MGRKVGKKTYEYHDPVRINKVPDGGYMYSHWYGRVGQTKKWQCGVSDLPSFAMEDIKGVLKHPLTLVKNMSTKDRNMWIRDKAPPLRQARRTTKHGRRYRSRQQQGIKDVLPPEITHKITA
jgi:hypothetical protein